MPEVHCHDKTLDHTQFNSGPPEARRKRHLRDARALWGYTLAV